MRRRVLLYSVLTIVVVGALTGAAGVAVSRSDLANTELTTAASAPPSLAAQQLPASLRLRWTAVSAVSSPAGAVAGSTVVTATEHEIAGADAATGRRLWSYRRENAQLCAWVAQDGAVIAAFRKSHGCRDLTALEQGTGARRWYRTLEVLGGVTMSSATGIAVAAEPTNMIAVDPGGGLNRWPYTKAGCTFGSSAVGSLATVILATCDGKPRLLGHDAYAEKEKWNIAAPAGATAVLGTEGAVAVLTQGGHAGGETGVLFYDAEGKSLGRVTDPALGVEPGTTPVTRISGSTLLVWTGTRVVAVDAATRSVRWAAPSRTPAAITANDQVVLTNGDTVETRSIPSGQSLGTSSLSGTTIPAGATVARVGAVLVVTNGGRTSVYG